MYVYSKTVTDGVYETVTVILLAEYYTSGPVDLHSSCVQDVLEGGKPNDNSAEAAAPIFCHWQLSTPTSSRWRDQ